MEQTELRHARLELIGSAAAGIAHDLNNQFTLILNHLAGENVASAREAVSRCVSLTSGLLSFCRGETTPLQPTSLIAVIQQFVTRLVLPFDVKVVLDIAANAATVSGDATAIERVLDNLVRNACKAMNGGGLIRITVRGAAIEIEDSGPGIPPENLPHIFEPFFTTGGTGLGLAVVRDIMRRHGGSATAASEPGRGAKFTLRFRASHLI